MIETAIISRQDKLANPFINELEQHPHLDGLVVPHKYGDRIRVPGVTVSINGGAQRLDHPGDSWGFNVEITARRKPGDYDLLDNDAAAIEEVTSTLMAGDPNISRLIAEEESSSEWGTEGKVRTFTMSIPVLVVFT